MLSFYVPQFYTLLLIKGSVLEGFACIEVHGGCWGFHMGLMFLGRFVEFILLRLEGHGGSSLEV